MLRRIRSELKCLEELGQNSKVWKDKARIRMFGRIRSEFQCLAAKVRILMLGRIRSELQYFEG